MPTPYIAQVSPLEAYRAQALDIASDLCYSPETMDRIRLAKTETEISNILTGARNNDGVYHNKRRSRYYE